MKHAILLILLMLTVTSAGFAQQFTYYYPEIASGSYGQGYCQTTIFLTNTSAPGGVEGIHDSSGSRMPR